eukprot:1156632-Pelagomonas_calceolata.AAC.14
MTQPESGVCSLSHGPLHNPALTTANSPTLLSRKFDSRYSHHGLAAAGMDVPNRPSAAAEDGT